MEETIKLPKPFGSYVLTPNPVYGKEDAMKKELEKMPEKEREAYLKVNVFDVCQRVKIVAVGKDVREITVGMEVMLNPDQIQSGISVMEGKYIMFRESNFLAEW